MTRNCTKVNAFDEFFDEPRTRMVVPEVEPVDTTDPTSLFFPQPRMEVPPPPPRFSFFERPIYNKIPSKEMTLADAYNYIISDVAKSATESLRAISSKEEAQAFKAKNFDYVTPAGIFTERRKDALVTASGLLVIDIDKLPDSDAVEDTFLLLLGVPRLETQLLFRSPSGLGLKWIIQIVNNEGHDHEYYFRAVTNYLATFGVEVDQSGKDVCRGCYLPHDARAYLNPKCAM